MEIKPKPKVWPEGDGYACARPYKSIFPHLKGDWWKRQGLIGRGATIKEALDDLHKWEDAAAIVRSIY